MRADALRALAASAHEEVTANVLPFWAERAPDRTTGGFAGRIDADGRPDPSAPRGTILNARLLWTFSEAARRVDDARYRPLADCACSFVSDVLWDHEHGGLFWSVAPDGAPLDRRKHVYAQAFGVYAFAAYHRATGHAGALDRARELYALIERHAAGEAGGDYAEAFSERWGPLVDVRLSEKDLNAPRSTNTHLHVLEAYALLLRVWPDAALRDRLAALVRRFFDSILDASGRACYPFFDAAWRPVSSERSFGHDIETAWLLVDAAEAVGDAGLIARARAAAVTLADAVRCDGQDADGGLFNAEEDGRLDADKYWWPQAEAVVGFLAAYEAGGSPAFLGAARAAWAFVQARVVDPEGGEWFERLDRTGVPYPGHDKAGFWKCPYHNARACFEVGDRVGRLLATAPAARAPDGAVPATLSVP